MFDLNTIASALATGVPVLIGHILLAMILFAAGVRIHIAITPIDEPRLVAAGNMAAGIALAGAFLGMAIPLAATLATSKSALDIVLWGIVALIVQIALYAVASLAVRGLRGFVEAGNVAVGTVLAAAQISIALLVAAALAV